jgi:uncharacterized membrane protein YgcG
VPDADGFTQREVDEMARAADAAGERCGLRFSVFVGQAEGDPATYAQRLLAALGPDASRAVLLLVDPQARRVEIVAGTQATQLVDDRACRMAILAMTSALPDGAIVDAVVTGLRVLGDAAFWRKARSPARQ